ncbi:Asp-tRNA(Asn)/Glu-tRNA(Gln) amidotransferase subunit GatA [Candidatus Saccharibacteria bacterium]|nr:Asp-tRNA(Asn)/Glu-tRNA(Gln) amidotransferase subunit GatA [Candidatus Saccharibacteria bacterium]
MKIATKENPALKMVQEALEKAKKYQSSHNIFVTITEEEALARAKEIDEKIQKGAKVGKLAGVPYALKDNFLSKQGPTTASAKILEPFHSPLNATAVDLLEKEGAICIGRTNMDAFAHGSSTENSYFGPTKNAHDTSRVAGGSSGGSAVAVALDIVQFATGTDTGGSIRQPAAFNGVYGLKPTYGAISRYGVVAMASSTDCIGFFTKTPEDLDLLMSITAKTDNKDMTTLPTFYNEEASPDRSGPITIGIIKDFNNKNVHPEIQKSLNEKISLLKKKGYKIKELEMPALKYALAVYYIVVPAEISSNLSRHDGIRYGYRTNNIKDLPSLYANSRKEGLMPENKRRIMIGNFVLSSGFYDAYYLKAQKARTLIIKEYEKAFAEVDFLLTPVAPNPAFKLGEKVNDPVSMYLEDVMSVPLNLAGLPGLAIPAGKTSDNLPIGLQLIGPRRSDKSLIAFAKELA